MLFYREIEPRKKLRLPDFSYEIPGYYYVTICTNNRACLFGDVIEGCMHLNSSGNMIQDTLLAMPQYYPGWQTDCFVIMPNHVHAVMVLSNSNEVRVQGPARRPAPTIESNNKIKLLESSIATAISLPELIRNIKSYTTTCYRKGVLTKKWPPFERQLWQRSYYEHIIRNETSLNKIQEYIVQNPAQWDMDRENPSYNVPF